MPPRYVTTELQAQILAEITDLHSRRRALEEKIRKAEAANLFWMEQAALKDIEAFRKLPPPLTSSTKLPGSC